jgi:hypothetical protein
LLLQKEINFYLTLPKRIITNMYGLL